MKKCLMYLFPLLCLSLGGCFWTRSSFDLSTLKNANNIIDVAVIGSGPSGHLAGIYAKRGGMHAVVFEGDMPGGLLTQTSMVENWPGEVAILGPDIMKKLKEQGEKLGVEYIPQTIEKVDFSSWPYKLETSAGETVQALSVVIATGAGPRRLKICGEDQYWGLGVTSCAVCDAPFYKDEEVVVIGGGDSAVEEAIQLTPYAKKITILVRKDKMRAAPRMQEHLKSHSKINVRYDVEVNKIVGDDTKVTGVELFDVKKDKNFVMPTSGVFLAIGHIPNTKVFTGQVKMDADGFIVMTKGRTQSTSVPGVFAAGDVEDREYRQAGVAAGSGIKAGLDALNFLNDIGITPAISEEINARRFHVEEKKEKSPDVEAITSLEQFKSFKEGDKLAVVDFYADYCPSCIQMLPAFAEVAQESQDIAHFAKVNVEDAEDLADQLFISSIPCLMVFRNNELVARYNQAMTKQELVAAINQCASGTSEQS